MAFLDLRLGKGGDGLAGSGQATALEDVALGVENAERDLALMHVAADEARAVTAWGLAVRSEVGEELPRPPG